jgi:glycosyltransferase involved in cell wall biosynthesis
MNSPLPIFSIVIPTYNRAAFLEAALKSLQAQSCTDFEVIVCDDGSTDNSQECAMKFSGVLPLTYLKLKNSGGPASARNHGIRHARGEWICFLDSDDWWYPTKLEETAKAISTSDFIYHQLDVYVRGIKNGKTLGASKASIVRWQEMLFDSNSIPNSSVCVRRSVLTEIGEFDERPEMRAVEDFDLWIRIRQKTQRFHYIAKPLGGYFLAENSKAEHHLTEASIKQVQRHRTLLDKYLPQLSSHDQQLALRNFRFHAAWILSKSSDTSEVLKYLNFRLLWSYWPRRQFWHGLYLLWHARSSSCKR